ncbi:MAG TPA: hypothetical protein VGO91_07100 [Pyrinomonadaceae bacterium]|nr:hypothetical protein [Pyrinomonadaceae bacterium]
MLLCLLVVCVACGVALGQSGRRSGKQGDATPSQSQAVQKDETATSSVNPVETAKLSLFVADHFPSDEIPSSVAREIVQSFYGRLRERSDAIAVTWERDLSRKDAVERARKVQRTFVVWLQVQVDTPEGGRASREESDYETLATTYVVFMPGTAEVKTEGRVYYQQLNGRALNDSKNRRRRRPPPLRLPAEETLEGVGRAAADRVLASFKDQLPPSQP